MKIKTKFAILLSAKLLVVSCMLAQSPSQGAAQPAPAPADQPAPAPPSAGQAHTSPLFWVSSVEVMRSAHSPQLDVIRVRGLASTNGWESAELVPMTKSLPPDGVLDLAFVAEPPANNTTPIAYPELEAVFVMEPGHPFKGVRVHGAANRVTLYTLPGYAVSQAPPKDCAECLGKVFVPRGQTATSAAAIVREEDLPRNLRVIRESDGIGTLESNPNRMTLLLNEKGQIVMALWD